MHRTVEEWEHRLQRSIDVKTIMELYADLREMATLEAMASKEKGSHETGKKGQGPIAIEGTGPMLWQLTTAYYDYTTDPSHCPICGGVGIPWRGWFHCDGTCHAIAVVADGRTYLPISKDPYVSQNSRCADSAGSPGHRL